MAKEKFERSKPHVNIGTIGPFDLFQSSDSRFDCLEVSHHST